MVRRQHDDPSESDWWAVPGGYEPIPKHSAIYGEYWLDHEYYIAFVPHHADLAFTDVSQESSNPGRGFTHQAQTISSSYSVLQAFIGIVQALWAIIAIYQARGDQIQQYGYAAFGLEWRGCNSKLRPHRLCPAATSGTSSAVCARVSGLHVDTRELTGQQDGLQTMHGKRSIQAGGQLATALDTAAGDGVLPVCFCGRQHLTPPPVWSQTGIEKSKK